MKIPTTRRCHQSHGLRHPCHLTIGSNEAYGWHFQYLTVIGLSLSTLTFAIGLLADVTLSARLFLIKNLLSICSAPLEVLISILYWGLRVVSARYSFRVSRFQFAS